MLMRTSLLALCLLTLPVDGVNEVAYRRSHSLFSRGTDRLSKMWREIASAGKNRDDRLAPPDPNDKRIGSVLWMHVHIPKTGGTTLSSMLVCDFCKDQRCQKLAERGWIDRCSEQCPTAHIDTEFHCMDTTSVRRTVDLAAGEFDFYGLRREHAQFEVQRRRADAMAHDVRASGIVYVTLLRTGANRAISHWAHEMSSMPEQIMVNNTLVGRFSNESLYWYISNPQLAQWANFRNNNQIALLASVPDSMKISSFHLKKAQMILTKPNRQWKVGFTHCLALFRRHLQEFKEADKLRAANKTAQVFLEDRRVQPYSFFDLVREQEALPRLEHRTPTGLVLSEEVVKYVEERNSLDTELYNWALNQDDKERFIGAGDPACMMNLYDQGLGGFSATNTSDADGAAEGGAPNETNTFF